MSQKRQTESKEKIINHPRKTASQILIYSVDGAGLRSGMRFSRSSGILLHPTCLPNSFGIGRFGPSAFAFVDFLKEAGQKLWQVLPLNPTGYGDSPFQCFSANAGNHLLI